MLTFPAPRAQGDGLGDIVSQEIGAPTDGEVHTRQEYGDDADVNTLLAKFGVEAFSNKQPIYTETDYGLDLQQAMTAVEAARQANYNVPAELRQKYPNWLAVLNGAENGEYERDLARLAESNRQQKALEDEAARIAEEKANIRRRQRAEREVKRDLEDATPSTPKETPKE